MADRTLDSPGAWRLDTYLVERGGLAAGALTLLGAEGHHAADVVRVREGDLVRLIDGRGLEGVARVERTARGEAGLLVEEVREHTREGATELTVAQALLKGRSFDEVVRRCSELGVAAILPVVTERTVARADAAGAGSKRARWEAIALAAVKQSRGVFLPRILDVAGLDGVVRAVPDHERLLVAWEEEHATGLGAALGEPVPRRILVVVGPEGGLTGDEVKGLAGAGARPVSVGRRVLRADWAAAAIAAMVSHTAGGLLP